MAEFFGPRLYSCCNCRNHVSLHDDIVSKAFQVSMDLKENVKLTSMTFTYHRQLSESSNLSVPHRMELGFREMVEI
ncbi:uncharacterized protein LOC131319836 isoform X2 [Rhododendron vialii]|uniref:uncharacterized protein LOC131319836 isoform X2 n=1 Tax=Rhododendron vialii TaxID=182163 RepID=UPI00265F345F|nr:uncharacterized protein LOC131319836 isoform X2 [Rhododendron vialii]XP_058206233.1 uncharacterized protein LOC131319836 isoform X2 [Rhododendron vialii]